MIQEELECINEDGHEYVYIEGSNDSRDEWSEDSYQCKYCKTIRTIRLYYDEFGIYALDSLDALMSKETDDIAEAHVEAHKKDKEYTKGTYQGAKPKFLSSIFFPKVVEAAKAKKCLVLIVSQLRDNVGGGLYAPKDKISNGRALLFYTDTRVWLETKQPIIKGERQIGVVTKLETSKTRGPNPYRECMFTTYFTYGIDNVGSNVDYLYDLRTPERGELRKTEAKACEWDENTYTREALIAHIEENNLEKELESRVIAKWNAMEEEATSDIRGRKPRFAE
jgi:hypothetical protein